MVGEYNQDLIISCYKITHDISVYVGKYSYRESNIPGVVINISHYDKEMGPLFEVW